MSRHLFAFWHFCSFLFLVPRDRIWYNLAEALEIKKRTSSRRDCTYFLLKCICSEITFSIFWKFNISKTLFQSLNRVWKKWWFCNTWKLCDFALKNGLRIARPKCPDDVVVSTSLRDCNTIRRLLAMHNINFLVVSWRFKESAQFRIARHVLPQKPFLLINSVHNTTSQEDIEQ